MQPSNSNSPSADRQAQYEKYLPYLTSIAKKVKKNANSDIEVETLIEYGRVGLFEALDTHEDSGQGFMTHAYYLIRGAMLQALRNRGDGADDDKLNFEEKANELLSESARRRASGDDDQGAANPFELSVEDLGLTVQRLAAVYLTSKDAAVSSRDADVDGLIEARQLVRESFKELNTLERKLLNLYYYKKLKLEEVADALGLSNSRARYLHTRVADKIQRHLSSGMQLPEKEP